MGGGEGNKTGKEKEPKASSTVTSQEQPSTTSAPAGQDWPGFQAYSPMPPPGYLASSPQTHPYMWGVQHIMPPYGTPPHPYVAMYPHSGMYAHPSIPPGSYPFSPYGIPSPNGIPEASGTPGTGEQDARPSDAKEKLPIKRSKGSLGNLNVITGKNSDNNKTRTTPPNGVYSKSAESESEGSSEGSDANSHHESQNKSGGGQDSLEDLSQNGGAHNGEGAPNAALAIVSVSGTNTNAASGPATNLNIGMDYWGASSLHGKIPSTQIVPGTSRDGPQSQLWFQDERELKRQKRKQSNRESARRSRLRKQAECDELGVRAAALKEENDKLRAEVSRLKHDYDHLVKENASLKETLGQSPQADGAVPAPDDAENT